MLNLDLAIIRWIIIWAFIGSTLGFFAIRNVSSWTIFEKCKQYLLSLGVGIFFAFPVCIFLCEKEVFSTSLNIMLAGTFSFAISDIIIKRWSSIIDAIAIVFHKVIEKLIGKF